MVTGRPSDEPDSPSSADESTDTDLTAPAGPRNTARERIDHRGSQTPTSWVDITACVLDRLENKDLAYAAASDRPTNR